jgi:MoaA/NifB/PqqE/SkfB family radical SAM enzyme
LSFIEEGIGSYFDETNTIIDNVKNIFLSEYSGLKYQNDIGVRKTILLSKRHVKDIIHEIRLQNNLDFSYLKREKQVLILGQHVYRSFMSEEDEVEFYKNNIDVLLEEGYNILFKLHPRHSAAYGIGRKLFQTYKDSEKFLIFPENIRYPIELLIPDLELKAILTAMSGAGFNVNHLFDIPVYDFDKRVVNFSDRLKRYHKIFLEYLPNMNSFIEDYEFKKLNIALNLEEVPKFTQIRLETTNRCGYNCFMCPRKKLTRKIGTMSMEDLNYVIECFKFINYELDFHMHGYGETLLCDDLPERCKLITSQKPNFTPLIFTTLGYERDFEWFERLFKSGLGIVKVSLYGYDEKTYESAHGVNKFSIVKKNLEILVELRKKYGFKLTVMTDGFGENYPLPKGYSKRYFSKIKKDFLQYLSSLNINYIFQRLHNFGAGFRNLSKENLIGTVPCSVFWGNRRQHISISWDLNVSPCAYDYNCSVVWGNLKEKSLEEIYKSKEHLDFIKSFLKLNNNVYEVCDNGNSCYPNEGGVGGVGGHDKQYKIVKNYMEDLNGL